MNKKIIKKLQAHDLWVESIGKAGTQLVLDEVDLEGGVTKEHHWDQSYLTCCLMRSSVLNEVDFYASEIHSCEFQNSSLSGVCFVKANVSYSNFSGCQFDHVDYKRAFFDSSEFRMASIDSCLMWGVGFVDCDMSQCVFKNCDFDGIYFDNDCFGECRFINVTNVDKAYYSRINVGTMEQPVMLEGEEAIQWITNRLET
ncbi:MAG: pentapeptide repeat-containing protein [Proteobacteria bacterium]|nr:pentapeptide repeat-containing protein [Pseudomonadota bacterium]